MKVNWNKVEDEWKPWIKIVEKELNGGSAAQDELLEKFKKRCPKSVGHAAAAALSVAKWHPAVTLSRWERGHFCGHCVWQQVGRGRNRYEPMCLGCIFDTPENAKCDIPCRPYMSNVEMRRQVATAYEELISKVPKKYLK